MGSHMYLQLFQLRPWSWFFAALCCIVSACAPIAPPTADTTQTVPSTITENVYDDKTIEIVVPFSAGGGTDTWARTIAPILQKHLGTNTRVQVINKPGASGVAGANAFSYNHNPETILASSGSIFFPYLLGDSAVDYNFNELVPILGSPVGSVVFVRADTGIQSIEDLCATNTTLNYGGISANGLDLVPLIAFDLLDLEVDTVFGYDGKSATRVVFEQGDTNIEYQTTPGYLANVTPLIETGEAIALFTFGLIDDAGDVVRDPVFPDLPTVKEVYSTCFSRPPSGVEWDVYKATLVAGFAIQKMMWVHRDTPEEAITALRLAADAATNDPLFKESAQNLIGNYEFYVGHEAQITFAAANNLSPDAITWLKSLLTRHLNE